MILRRKKPDIYQVFGDNFMYWGFRRRGCKFASPTTEYSFLKIFPGKSAQSQQKGNNRPDRQGNEGN